MNRRLFTDKPLIDLSLLALLLALLFGATLGDRPYSAPSESRYIEIGREMAQSGDFVTPRLDYVKYFEKPPLFYWIQAESTRLLGFDPFMARVPTAFFAILLCLLTYGLGRMLYGRLAGWLGALTLATSLYMFALSRVVLLDVPVSFFLTATLTAFLYAADAPAGSKRTFILYAMYAAAACAVLTKGLIGAVLPGIVALLWLAFTRRWALLKELKILPGTLLFLLIAVPWHVLVSLRNPEFPHFYFIHEHLERYTTREHGRYQPDWFFLAVLMAGLFPWVVFAWQAVKTGLAGFWNRREKEPTALFLFLWIAFILAFFSLSDSKLIPYILPIFPPIAALIGRYLAQAWDENGNAPGFGSGLLAMMMLFAFTAIAPTLILHTTDPDSKVAVALQQGGDDTRNLSIAGMMLACALLVVFIQGKRRHLIVTMIAGAGLFMGLGDEVAGHYNRDSMQFFSSLITQFESDKHARDSEVISYGAYFQDLPLYLNRRITIAGWKGELEFGGRHEDTSAWLIDDAEFQRRWMQADKVRFAVMRIEMLDKLAQGKNPEERHLYILSADDRNVLLANQPPPAPQPQTPQPQTPKANP